MVIIYCIILFTVFSTLYSIIARLRGKVNGCFSSFIILILSIIIIESVYVNFLKDTDNNKETNSELGKDNSIKNNNQNINYVFENNSNYNTNINKSDSYLEDSEMEDFTYDVDNDTSHYIDDDSDYYTEDDINYYLNDDSGYYAKDNNNENNYNQQNYYYPNQNLNIKTKVRVGAVCNDGTYSNATGRGACSHHGGVAYWVYE